MKKLMLVMFVGMLFLAAPLIASADGGRHERGPDQFRRPAPERQIYRDHRRSDVRYYQGKAYRKGNGYRGKGYWRQELREARQDLRRAKRQLRHSHRHDQRHRRTYAASTVLIGVPNLVLHFGW